MNSFTAIDFETAQGKRWSICQVGLVRMENEIITDQLSLLVQPPDNYHWPNFIEIHGITLSIRQMLQLSMEFGSKLSHI